MRAPMALQQPRANMQRGMTNARNATLYGAAAPMARRAVEGRGQYATNVADGMETRREVLVGKVLA